MKKRLAVALTALALAVTPSAVFADETDALDIIENGIQTEAMVYELKEAADNYYENEDYEAAAEAYYETAIKANYLANIMSQCLEPYYSSSSNYKTVPDGMEDDLVALENKSNELIDLRNICYVYEGISYNKMGEQGDALAVLYKALGLITTSEKDIWRLAANEVMTIIGYEAIGTTYALLREEAEEYIGKEYAEFVEAFGVANEDTEKKEDEILGWTYAYHYYDALTVRTEFDENGVEYVASIY